MVTYRFRLRSESEFKIDSQCASSVIYVPVYIDHLLMLLVPLTEVTAVQTVVFFIRGFAVIQLEMQKILK